jgi:UV DNA damage endonuclease
MAIKRMGFACKFSEIDVAGNVVGIPELQGRTTTVTWLGRQTKDVAVERLWELLNHNIGSTTALVKKVGSLDQNLRMVRLGSELLPVYSHPDWKWFWKQADVIAACAKGFAKIGELARALDVRLSFHPGQFVVLASISEGIVNRSIEEFEYHADMARWMGYGKRFQDFKINVHISGRLGPDGIRAAYQRLSPEARNCITIENEENSWGLDDCLTLTDLLPIVMDIHHHFIREGEYIDPTDPRVQQVIDSWRGVTPTMHYSVSREDLLIDHCKITFPDMDDLLAAGYKKQKLRAHSDAYWNESVNEWAVCFNDRFDIMCESKFKNIASFALADYAKSRGIF